MITKENITNLIGKDPDKLLIVVRGHSGSGKSTLANYIVDECEFKEVGYTICEADHYHYDDYGNYCFDVSKLQEAHAWCRGEVTHNLINGYSCIVSNTSTTIKEFQKYLDLAKLYDYRVVVLRATGNFKDIHNVPAEVLQRQKSRFEDYEGEIYVR